MILILAHEPVFEPLDLPNYTECITRSITNLSAWKEVPFMQEPLTRIYQFTAKRLAVLTPE